MGLTGILLFGVFILPISIGIILLKKSRRLATIFLSVPFVFMIGVVGWWFYESNYRFVSSTDLSSEQIGDYAIRDEMTDDIFITFGDYEERDNVNYNELFVFEDVEFGTSIHDDIIFIQTYTVELTTMKDIKIGDQIEHVIERYGDNYFRGADMGLGDSISYVDRDHKLHLQFWLEDDIVTHISLKAI